MSLIWLVSYPKSGNTWLRVFLSNYQRDGDAPADINQLEKMGIASAHQLFERYSGVESSDLTPDEIDSCRPEIYRLLVRDCEEGRFVKAHDAYTLLPDGRPLFPSEGVLGAIYVVRNPLDVALSLMHHMNDSGIDKTIVRMANSAATLAASVERGYTQFRQRLLTWSGHVCSWLDSSKDFPVHLVRYEDLQRDPVAAFAEVVSFAGLPLDEQRLEKAIRFSRFGILQQQEVLQGFRERPRARAPFFRQGEVGGWRNHLDSAQAGKIVADHEEVMRRLRYLTPDGSLVF